MKKTLYALFAAGTLLLLAPDAVHAAPALLTDSPVEASRKLAARERVAVAKKAAAAKKSSARNSKMMTAKFRQNMLAALGLDASKSVTTPAERNHQLHLRQKQLRVQTRQESHARRVRCVRQFN